MDKMKQVKTIKMRGFMPIVRITRGNQITIPSEIRKSAQLGVGDYVEVTFTKSGDISLKPVEVIPKKSRRAKQKANLDKETEAQERLSEEEMLQQYGEDDSVYDNIKL